MQPDWLSFDEALERIIGDTTTLDTEMCPIREARTRVLADALTSAVEIPRWTNSAMDGFAVRAADVRGATRESPVSLAVVDDVSAGEFPHSPVEKGQAVRVMTGGAVPDGADTVVRVEHTDAGKDIGLPTASVLILDDQDAGRNLRRKGEDIGLDTVVLKAGMEMTPAALGVAASIGYPELPVFRRPLVALLTSGDELVEVEDFEAVREGRRIVSSNSYSLSAQIRAAGCDIRYLGIAPDDPAAIRTALLRAEGCDAVVTSAGISVGEHDHTKGVLEELDTTIAFWRVRIRPGSPFAYGRIGALSDVPWFGLPGNPVSSMVTFELFIHPALRRMAGHRAIFRRPVSVSIREPVSSSETLTQFLRVRLTDEESGIGASLAGAQGSGILSSMIRANGLMIVPAGAGEIEAGTPMTAIPLEEVGYSVTPWTTAGG